MPNAIRLFVHAVEALNRVVGRFAMYLIFAILGVLLYSSISKTFFVPAAWTLEIGPVSDGRLLSCLAAPIRCSSVPMCAWTCSIATGRHVLVQSSMSSP